MRCILLCLILFYSINARAIDLDAAGVEKRMTYIRTLEDPSVALLELVKLRNETSYFHNFSKTPLTREYVNRYMLAFEKKRMNERINSCAGMTKSLRRKAAQFANSANSSNKCNPYPRDKAVGEIFTLIEQSQKIVKAPHNEEWFTSNLTTSARAGNELGARHATDSFSAGNVYRDAKMRKEMQDNTAASNTRIQNLQKTADQNLYIYSQDGTQAMSDMVDKKYGFEANLNEVELTDRARKLHERLMRGNRDNNFNNYLFFTQNFNFSPAETKLDGLYGNEARGVLETFSAKMYHGATLTEQVHLASNLPKYEDEHLANIGLANLKAYKKSRGGGPPLSQDQVYSSLSSILEKLKTIPDYKNRVAFLNEQTPKTPYGFFFQTAAFREGIKSTGNLSPEVYKNLLKNSLKEQIKNTTDYASKVIERHQGEASFWGQHKVKAEYDEIGSILLYSSPGVIQDAMGEKAERLGGLCGPMKASNELRKITKIDDYVEYGGKVIAFVPVVGTAASMLVGSLSNAMAAEEDNRKAGLLKNASDFASTGDKMSDRFNQKTLSENAEDRAELNKDRIVLQKSANKRNAMAIVAPVVSAGVSVGSNALFSKIATSENEVVRMATQRFENLEETYKKIALKGQAQLVESTKKLSTEELTDWASEGIE